MHCLEKLPLNGDLLMEHKVSNIVEDKVSNIVHTLASAGYNGGRGYIVNKNVGHCLECKELILCETLPKGDNIAYPSPHSAPWHI